MCVCLRHMLRVLCQCTYDCCSPKTIQPSSCDVQYTAFQHLCWALDGHRSRPMPTELTQSATDRATRSANIHPLPHEASGRTRCGRLRIPRRHVHPTVAWLSGSAQVKLLFFDLVAQAWAWAALQLISQSQSHSVTLCARNRDARAHARTQSRERCGSMHSACTLARARDSHPCIQQ